MHCQFLPMIFIMEIVKKSNLSFMVEIILQNIIIWLFQMQSTMLQAILKSKLIMKIRLMVQQMMGDYIRMTVNITWK